MCMIAGFVIENFTDRGGDLIQAVERYSLPVFIVFFAINGANLDWSLLANVWPLVVLLVAVRIAAIWLGTSVGSSIAGDEAPIRRNLWLGFLTQAGVTLGLATLIEARIPGMGTQIKTIVIAMIAINQVVGPLAFRFGLFRSGEARAAVNVYSDDRAAIPSRNIETSWSTNSESCCSFIVAAPTVSRAGV